jgi:hypothetical protein
MRTIDLQSVFADGVCVTRRLQRGGTGPPVVTYDVESQRGEPVTVALIDRVPGGDPTAIDFHVDYGLGDWTVEGERIVFERELTPSETCQTLYRLRDVPVSEAESEFSKPVVETDATLIENPVLDLRDPRAEATDGGTTPSEGERE